MSLALVQGMATVVVQSALKFRSGPSLLALVAHLDCGQAPKSQRIPVRSRACGILEECVCVRVSFQLPLLLLDVFASKLI